VISSLRTMIYEYTEAGATCLKFRGGSAVGLLIEQPVHKPSCPSLLSYAGYRTAVTIGHRFERLESKHMSPGNSNVFTEA